MNRITNVLMLACLAASAPIACIYVSDRDSYHIHEQPVHTDEKQSDASDASAEPTHPALREKLSELAEKDQEARNRLLEAFPNLDELSGGLELTNPTTEQLDAVMAVRRIDAETTAYIKRVIDEHGFPTYDMVGEQGAKNAWLLVQHADEDPEFQARALELMEPLVEKDQADPSDYAHLTDRVLLAQGKKQRFATQLEADDAGVLRPRPVENPEKLDTRRETVGLLPLATHLELVGSELDQPTSPEPLGTDE